jgi:hypothetical protein
MATPEIDIGQLSEEQQLALGQYTSVTAQDVPAAVALLQRSQWNVQVSYASRLFRLLNNLLRLLILDRLQSPNSLMERVLIP